MVAVVGAHSFQDYNAYRDRVLAMIDEYGLDQDVVLLGTVPDAELPGWFHAADGFVFPSVNEGWGLAILEAISAGLPVVASDLDVFQEFLDGQDAILTRAGGRGLARRGHGPPARRAGHRGATARPWRRGGQALHVAADGRAARSHLRRGCRHPGWRGRRAGRPDERLPVTGT